MGIIEQKQYQKRLSQWIRNTALVSYIRSLDTYVFFVVPSLIGVVIFFLFPLLDVVRRSFCAGTGRQFIGLFNYRQILHNKAFLLAVGNTLKFELVCLPLLLLISLLVAVGVFLNRQNWLKFAFLVPLAIPSNSVAVLWKILFEQQGIVNGIRNRLWQFPVVDYLNSDNAFWVLLVTYLWKNIGYNMLIWQAGLAAIPDTIYDAAKLDGAGLTAIVTKIMLPNLKPSLYAVSVLSFVNSFKVFREAYLIAGNYPNPSMYLLQHLFNNWFQKLDIGKLSAAAVMTAIFLFAVLTLLRLLLCLDKQEGIVKRKMSVRITRKKDVQMEGEEI